MNYEDLERLNEMKQKGIITEEEFEREKTKIFIDSNSPAQSSNTLHRNDTEKSKDHSGYKRWSSIVLIILSALLMINTGNEAYGDSFLVFFLPGLLGLIAGILKLTSKENNNMLLAAGICSISGTIINGIGILDISIFGIFALVFGVLDIKYANSINDE